MLFKLGILFLLQGLASDESHVEVFIPAQDLCLYVDPGSVNILRNPPEAFRYLRRSPNDMPQRFPNENITIDVDFTAEVTSCQVRSFVLNSGNLKSSFLVPR